MSIEIFSILFVSLGVLVLTVATFALSCPGKSNKGRVAAARRKQCKKRSAYRLRNR